MEIRMSNRVKSVDVWANVMVVYYEDGTKENFDHNPASRWLMAEWHKQGDEITELRNRLQPEARAIEPAAWISPQGLEMLKDHRGDPKASVAHAKYAVYTVPLYLGPQPQFPIDAPHKGTK